MPTLRERHLRDGVAKTLPLLQRYARTLTGNAAAGRALVDAVHVRFQFDADGIRLKAQLFARLQNEWAKSTQSKARGVAMEMFLLHRMEGFSLVELSRIFDLSEPYTFRLLSKSEADARDALPSRVLILERDALITIDLCDCLEGLGYNVVGIARTMPEAALKARETTPQLVITDYVLTDRSPGAQAMRDALGGLRLVPTIFLDPPDPDAVLKDETLPGFSLEVPFLAADVEAVMRQADSLSRYEAAKALL